MSKNGSIRYQIEKELKSKCRFGESRDKAKKEDIAKNYIYSFNTLKTYLKQLNYMVDWCKTNNIKLKKLEDLKVHGDKWLKSCVDNGMSPWTVTTRRAALCKLLGIPYSYFETKIPTRNRNKAIRSRDMKKSLTRFSEFNNQDQVTFCKCSGLRLRELKLIEGSALFFDNNGRAGIHVTKGTKGGKKRDVIFYGSSEEITLCIELCKKSDGLIFEKVNENANTHGYRAEFCQRVYNAEKRDLDTLPRSEKVFCRKDKKGIVYDKKALLICSKMLGHNRYDVCNFSYLY